MPGGPGEDSGRQSPHRLAVLPYVQPYRTECPRLRDGTSWQRTASQLGPDSRSHLSGGARDETDSDNDSSQGADTQELRADPIKLNCAGGSNSAMKVRVPVPWDVSARTR